LLISHQIEHEHVDSAWGEEELVCGIVHILAGKVPHREVQTPVGQRDVADVDTVGGQVGVGVVGVGVGVVGVCVTGVRIHVVGLLV
jgi:hypothetical protein